MTTESLPPARLQQILSRLGLTGPPAPTREGLEQLYLGWCRNVPFDNVRKRIALQRGDAGGLPGGHAHDFFDAWLRHGTGGTCWPTSNALYTLLVACGFDTRRISASMQDVEIPNHGSAVVRLDGQDYVVDSSILCEAPVPLRPGEKFEIACPVHPIHVEPVGESWRIWWGFVMNEQTMPCRLLEDPVEHAFFLERYEISREMSPFNMSLYARRNRADGIVSFLARTRFLKTAAGVTAEELSEEQLAAALVDDLGLSPEIVAALRDTCTL